MRMRTKLLLCLLFVSFGLTALSLLVIRSTLERHIRGRLGSDLNNSLVTFRNLQSQRREMLRREAALLADLPSLKALLTAPDTQTIQDGAAEFWKVSGSDFFALVKPDGSLQAIYARSGTAPSTMAERELSGVVTSPPKSEYLLHEGALYEVAAQPLYFGERGKGTLLGGVALGYEINDRVARQVSDAAAARVVFFANGRTLSSTLPGNSDLDIASILAKLSARPAGLTDVYAGKKHWVATSARLSGQNMPVVDLLLLKSYDEASSYLFRLNELIAAIGMLVLLTGSLLAVYLSGSITRPLEQLASSVHALGEGDFESSLPRQGATEVTELSDAFATMRRRLKQTQQELVEAERLATIGEMASSISHDLRHHLSAVYANAEFLGYPSTSAVERADLLQEIRLAVHGMTEMIDSLLLFSHTGRTLHLTMESVPQLVERTVALVKAHPDAASVHLSCNVEGSIESWLDAKKVERAIYNLLLNACQAARLSSAAPEVSIAVRQREDMVDIEITDNGAGVAGSIRESLFDPFVSEGKQTGVGLGLTLAQRIAREHGGEVTLAESTGTRTVFLIRLPARGVGAFAVATDAAPVAPRS